MKNNFNLDENAQPRYVANIGTSPITISESEMHGAYLENLGIPKTNDVVLQVGMKVLLPHFYFTFISADGSDVKIRQDFN